MLRYHFLQDLAQSVLQVFGDDHQLLSNFLQGSISGAIHLEMGPFQKLTDTQCVCLGCIDCCLSKVTEKIKTRLTKPTSLPFHLNKRKSFIACAPSVPQGMLLSKDIRDRERGGRAEVRVIEGDAESSSPQNMELMNSVLGERTSNLTEGKPDEVVDQEVKANLTLYW